MEAVLETNINGTAPAVKTIKMANNIDILAQIRMNTPKSGVILNVQVTPAMAEKMLSLNDSNRPVKKAEVAALVDAMEAGRWIFNGDSIRFSSDMKLVDGQHKLMAIVQSQKPQIFHVQTGLPPEAFATIDTGKKRSAGDVLATHGIVNQNVTAAAIKAFIYFKTKQSVGGKISGQRVNNQTMAAWVENRNNMKLMVEAVNLGIKTFWPAAKFMGQSTWSFLYFLFAKIDKDEAMYFLERLALGEDISRKKDSPIYHLRHKLESLRTKVSTAEGTKLIEVRMKYVVVAWNHFRRNEKVDKLVIDGKNPLIPKPI